MNDLQVLEKLISMDTQNPGTNYQQILNYLSIYLKQKGAKVYYIKKNIVASWGKPTLLINAHLDTVKAVGWVHDPLKCKIKNGKISGLGTADTKGNVYCILESIKEMPKNLLVLFSVDEEFGPKSGMHDFVKSKFAKKIKKAIVMEPTENKILAKHPGYYSFWLYFKSKKSNHSSLSKLNVIRKAAGAIVKLKDFNIGKIETINNAANITPKECKVKISIRTYLPHSKILKAIKKTAPAAKIQSSFIGPVFINKKSFIKTKNSANFWTEASVLSAAGINSIVYGAGSIKQAHSQQEYVKITSLERCVSFLKRAIGEYS